MKKTLTSILFMLFFVGTAFSQTVYVDYIDGDSSNTGLTASDPLKTISDVNTYIGVSGIPAAILFKKGMTHEADSILEISGGSSPLVIGSYGNSELSNPVITAASRIKNWEYVGRKEILDNGGFENWIDDRNPSGWNTRIRTGSSISRESGIVHEGTYSLKMSIGSRDEMVYIDQTNDVVPGLTYDFLVFLYSTNSGGTNDFRIIIRDNENMYWNGTAWTSSPYFHDISLTQNVWQSFSEQFAIRDTANELLIRISQNIEDSANNVFYIDGASLKGGEGSEGTWKTTSAIDTSEGLISNGQNWLAENTVTSASLERGTYYFNSGNNNLYVRLPDDEEPNVIENNKYAYALSISNTNDVRIENIGVRGATTAGIFLDSSSRFTIENVKVLMNGARYKSSSGDAGIYITGGTSGIIADSQFLRNGNFGVYAAAHDYLKIRYCEFVEDDMQLRVESSENVPIDNNTFENIFAVDGGGIDLINNNTDPFNNWAGKSYIRNNHIENAGFGIKVSGWFIDVFGNTIKGNGLQYGIRLLASSGVTTSEIDMHHNLISNAGNGVETSVSGGTLGNATLANNTIVESASNGVSLASIQAASVFVVKNNILFNRKVHPNAKLFAVANGDASEVEEDFNCFFIMNQYGMYNFGGTIYDSFAAYKAGSSQSDHSIFIDPDFMDEDSGNYILNPDSRIIDYGIGLGYVTDIRNTPILNTPDMGAYENRGPDQNEFNDTVYRFAYDANGNVEYLGKARPGIKDGDSRWQIKKITYDVNENATSFLYADGNQYYDNVWSNYASLNYN